MVPAQSGKKCNRFFVLPLHEYPTLTLTSDFARERQKVDRDGSAAEITS